MISPRGLVFPQLPMGWAGEKKNQFYSSSQYNVYDQKEDKNKIMTISEIINELDVDRHEVYYCIKKDKPCRDRYVFSVKTKEKALYLATNTVTGETIKGDVEVISKALGVAISSVRSRIGMKIARVWKLERYTPSLKDKLDKAQITITELASHMKISVASIYRISRENPDKIDREIKNAAATECD